MTQTPSAPASALVNATRPMGPGGSLLVMLLAGLIAGGASLAAVVLLKDFFHVPEEWGSLRETDSGVAKLRAAEAVMAKKNLVLTAGVLGALVAGVMGVAGGVRDGSPRHAMIGLLVGLVLGGGAGVASAYLGPVVGKGIDARVAPQAPIETKQNMEMLKTLAVHGTIWGLIGIAAALAATAPTRRSGSMVTSALGALVAAILAMAIYQVLMGNVFQVSRFELVLPQDLGPMIAWTLPTGILIGLAIGRLSATPQEKTASELRDTASSAT